MQNMSKSLEALKQMESQFETMLRQRRIECLKAFGHEAFCGCIFDAVPVAWDLSQYIAITTKSKVENGYDKLDADWKDAYDKVRPIRDKCVSELNF